MPTLILGAGLAGLAVASLMLSLSDAAALPQSALTAALARRLTRGPMESRVRNALSFVGRLRGVGHLDKVDIRLRAAGQPLDLTPAEISGVQLLMAMWLPLMTLAAIGPRADLAILGALIGWFYPEVWLMERTRLRHSAIAASLPFAMDLLSICVEAGLSFDGALSRIIDVLPASPLREEFVTVVREMRMGQSRREALRGLAHRTSLQEVNSLVSSLIQADQLGSGISTALPILAEQIRMKRFLAAEATAAKAPVKMLFPLAGLVFPCIIILLMGPLLLSGALNF